MIRPCEIVLDQCECVDPPVLNLSSEAPDPLIFSGVGYSPYDPYRPPPLGDGQYLARDCYGVAYSVLSQELANLLARMNAIVCQQGPNTNGWLYSNDRQEASRSCGTLGPGGVFNSWWYAVPAGTFVATFENPADGAAWVAAANAAALAFAQQMVQKYNACVECPALSSSDYWMCLNDELNEFPEFGAVDIPITLSGRNTGGTFNFEISAGSLPPGLFIVQIDHNSAAVGGTATTVGAYTFTIRAVNANNPNIYSEGAYTIDVIGITSAKTLPEAKVDRAYSHQLTGDVATGPAVYAFSILKPPPSGLTIDASTGLITGTVTAVGNYDFVVGITDSANGNTCPFDCSLAVTGPKFTNSPPNGVICTAYSFALTTSPAGSTFSAIGLPDHLTISAGGLISGTPRASNSGVTTVTAINGGETNTKDFTITIPPPGVGVPASSAKDIVWTGSHTQNGSGSTTMVGASGNGIATLPWDVACAGINSVETILGPLSNCGAAYSLTLTIDWTLPDTTCPASPVTHPWGHFSVNWAGTLWLDKIIGVVGGGSPPITSGHEVVVMTIPVGANGIIQIDITVSGGGTLTLNCSLTPTTPP